MRRISRILAMGMLVSYTVALSSIDHRPTTQKVEAHVRTTPAIETIIEPTPTPQIPVVEDVAPIQTVEESYISGWTTTVVNVRKNPSVKSDILDTYEFNKKIEYADHNKKWVKIKYKDDIAYICKDYISKSENKYKDYSAPKTSGFKSYMSYKAITSKSSPQYKLQNGKAYTGKYGIRQVDGRYCVAIGSHFGSEIGMKFDLILENDTVIPCILSDQKADAHTDSQNIITKHNGCLSEFIVDTNSLKHSAKIRGDISYCNKKWNSPVKTIRVYK